jgi:hypothetical protein
LVRAWPAVRPHRGAGSLLAWAGVSPADAVRPTARGGHPRHGYAHTCVTASRDECCGVNHFPVVVLVCSAVVLDDPGMLAPLPSVCRPRCWCCSRCRCGTVNCRRTVGYPRPAYRAAGRRGIRRCGPGAGSGCWRVRPGGTPSYPRPR